MMTETEYSTSFCRTNCCGINNYHGNCCSLQTRDWIIGPILDPYTVLENLRKKFSLDFNYDDIFIDYPEGSKLFPEKTVWQNPMSFPAMRINLESKNLNCIFYNNNLKLCTIHEIRPNTCKEFECSHLKQSKLIYFKKNV